jgi:hypothetical protein
LGDAAWARAKKNAEKAVFDYAARLLETHAQREIQVGYAFPPDNRWMREFESSFLYKETPDQLSAINATKADMGDERPMDRLICGDVGFGKTEVAIRAAFKAATCGKQVAILVPTTVLAEQHYRNFRERMSDYPIRVDMLSRFRTKAEQRAESLRKERFELIEKENAMHSRLDQIDVDIRPEMIDRSVAMAGSLRPEELREARRKSLAAEKQNLTNLLNEIAITKNRLEQDILRAEALVEKIRVKLDKDIDDALTSDQPDQ